MTFIIYDVFIYSVVLGYVAVTPPCTNIQITETQQAPVINTSDAVRSNVAAQRCINGHVVLTHDTPGSVLDNFVWGLAPVVYI